MMTMQVQHLGMLRGSTPLAKSAKAARPRATVHQSRRGLRTRAESSREVSEQAVKQTVAGGGYSGVCDIDQVKETLKQCAGLKGAALEACWADNGCDVNAVTDHYVKVAGMDTAKSNKVSAQSVKQTVGGGGYTGVCDIEHVKQTMKECQGLEGAALEACWADSGCDVVTVTEHYLKVAGMEPEVKV